MDQVVESPATGLIVALPSVPTAVTFTDEKEAQKLYAAIEQIVDAHVSDTSTKTGRDAIKSLAHRVAKVKVAIDKQGVALTEKWREDTKLVNASRKKIEEELERLQAKARKPYDDWEAAENARVAKHQDNLEALINLGLTPLGKSSEDLKTMLSAVEIMTIGDEWEEFKPKATVARFEAIGALTQLVAVAVKQEQDAAELVRLRAREEERDKADAERQRLEDEKQAEADRIENERLAEEQRLADIAKAAKDATDKAAQEAADLIAAAEQRAKDAEAKAQRAIDDAKAETDRLAEVERQRISDEEEEQRRRDENIEHCRTVNRAIIARLIVCADVSPDQARLIVTDLVRGAIPNVTLQY